MRTYVIRISTIVVSLFVWASSVRGQVQYEHIATVDVLLAVPLINDRNEIAYRTGTSGVVGGTGVWVYRDGINNLLAAAGQPAPGVPLPGATIRNLSAPFLSQSGMVTFHGTFNWDGGAFVDAIWAETTEGLALIAMRGTPVPGQPGIAFHEMTSPIMDIAGRVAFRGGFRVTTETGGIQTINGFYVHGPSTGTLPLLVEGEAAPGIADYELRHPLESLRAYDSGFVLSASSVLGGQVRHGIWSYIGDEPEVSLVAATPLVTDRGDSSWILGRPMTNRSDSILAECLNSWVVLDFGGIRTVVKVNDPLPGGDELTYRRVDDFPSMNPQGQVAFAARAKRGSSNFEVGGVWYDNAEGILTAVAVQGQQAPGFPGGTIFSGVFSNVVVSHTGQVAFSASLSQLSGPGLFMTDTNGFLHLVAHEGSEFLEYGTITHLRFGHALGVLDDWSNLSLAFNADGKLVFGASTLGGVGSGKTHIFTAVVPEPGAVVLVLTGTAGLLFGLIRRTRRVPRNSPVKYAGHRPPIGILRWFGRALCRRSW